MKPQFDPAAYADWFRTELGQRVWRDERRALHLALGHVGGLVVLDVGAGDGRLARELADRGARVVALDRSAAMLTAAAGERGGAGSDLSRVQADAARLPFADGSFDRVIAVTVLCFSARPGEIVREMARVTRPDGRVVLGELGRWSVWALVCRVRGWFAGGLWVSARFRTGSELRSILGAAGLRPGDVRGAVYYPRSGVAARMLGWLDAWLGARTTVGAAFVAAAGVKEHGTKT